jgi:apolipoprotein N-acyltransferase
VRRSRAGRDFFMTLSFLSLEAVRNTLRAHGGLPLLLAILSGFLFTLAFPPWSQEWLAGVGLVPFAVFFCYRRVTVGEAFFYGFVFGMAQFLTMIFWITEVTGPGWFALSVIMACYSGLWTMAWNQVASGPPGTFGSRNNIVRAILGACAWVALEWLRGWLFSGFGWNLLGVAMARLSPLIQVADLGGVYIVSWILMLLNLTFAVTIRRVHFEIASKIRPRPHLDFSFAMLLFGLSFVYGARLVLVEPEPWQSLRYLAVQPNLPQSVDAPCVPTLEAMNRFELLTYGALDGLPEDKKPELVIWPETPIGSGYFSDRDFYRTVQEITRTRNVALLFGANDEIQEGIFNAAFYVDAGGGGFQTYYKNHLVIMGEYVPLTDTFPALRKWSPIGINFQAGDKPGILELRPRDLRAGVLICFEDTLSRVARRTLPYDPALFINITNDGWFGASAQSRQHLNNAIFRCVEFRRPMIRVSNDGVTAVISNTGIVKRMLGRVEDGSYFEAGVMMGTLEIPKPVTTIYAQWGDWLVIVSALVGGYGLWRLRRGFAGAG